MKEEIKQLLSSKEELNDKQQKAVFEGYWKSKTLPSLHLSTNLGNLYTGSLYACLISLISDAKIYLEVSYSENNLISRTEEFSCFPMDQGLLLPCSL